MAGKLTRDAYARLINEDVEWLLDQPDTLERRHIEQVLYESVKCEYDLRAIVKAGEEMAKAIRGFKAGMARTVMWKALSAFEAAQKGGE